MGEGESLPPVNKRLDGGPELNGPRSGRMKKKKYFLFNFDFTRVFYPPASMKQMVDVRFLFYKLRLGAKKKKNMQPTGFHLTILRRWAKSFTTILDLVRLLWDCFTMSSGISCAAHAPIILNSPVFFFPLYMEVDKLDSHLKFHRAKRCVGRVALAASPA